MVVFLHNYAKDPWQKKKLWFCWCVNLTHELFEAGVVIEKSHQLTSVRAQLTIQHFSILLSMQRFDSQWWYFKIWDCEKFQELFDINVKGLVCFNLISKENVFSSFKSWNLITAFTGKQLEYGVSKMSWRKEMWAKNCMRNSSLINFGRQP